MLSLKATKGSTSYIEKRVPTTFLLSGQQVSHSYKKGKALKTKTNSFYNKEIISQVKSSLLSKTLHIQTNFNSLTLSLINIKSLFNIISNMS